MINKTQPMQDFTVKQTALQCQSTIPTIRKAIKLGLIKAYKLSERNTRITQAAIDDFKNNGGFSAI